MEIRDYFDPVTVEPDYRLGENRAFGSRVRQNRSPGEFPDWQGADIAIIGVSEYRNARLENSGEAANRARKCLYELSCTTEKMKVADLGNLRPGNTIEDSLAAIRDILAALLEKNTIPVILGGTGDLTLGMFQAYEKNNRTVNLTAIDSLPGLSSRYYDTVKSKSYLSKIISSRSKHLFNYSNIGYQSYFTGTREKNLLEDLFFDFFRLGVVRENISEMEPVIRDTDLLMASMSAVRQADAPAAVFPSPNGLTGEELCQLAWYGGKSERLTSLALFDWHPGYDTRSQTAQLAAHFLWYFIDGFYKRKGEYPFNPARDCTRYIVNLSVAGSDINFFKSNISDRWWMEVPSNRLPSSLMVPCSHEDYQRACVQEVPERWWQNFRKINN